MLKRSEIKKREQSLVSTPKPFKCLVDRCHNNTVWLIVTKANESDAAEQYKEKYYP